MQLRCSPVIACSSLFFQRQRLTDLIEIRLLMNRFKEEFVSEFRDHVTEFGLIAL